MYENVATLVCKRTLAREYGRVAFKERNVAWKSVVRASEVLEPRQCLGFANSLFTL